MKSSFGTNFTLTIFGESHGPAVGFVLDGLPAGIRLDLQPHPGGADQAPPGGTHLHPAAGSGRIPFPQRLLRRPHHRHAADADDRK